MYIYVNEASHTCLGASVSILLYNIDGATYNIESVP